MIKNNLNNNSKFLLALIIFSLLLISPTLALPTDYIPGANGEEFVVDKNNNTHIALNLDEFEIFSAIKQIQKTPLH